MTKYFFSLMLGAAIFTNESVYGMDEPDGGSGPRKKHTALSSSSDDDEENKALIALDHEKMRINNAVGSGLNDLANINKILKVSGDKIGCISIDNLKEVEKILTRCGCTLPEVEGNLEDHLAIESNIPLYLELLHTKLENYGTTITQTYARKTMKVQTILAQDLHNLHSILTVIIDGDKSTPAARNPFQSTLRNAAQIFKTNIEFQDPNNFVSAPQAPVTTSLSLTLPTRPQPPLLVPQEQQPLTPQPATKEETIFVREELKVAPLPITEAVQSIVLRPAQQQPHPLPVTQGRRPLPQPTGTLHPFMPK